MKVIAVTEFGGADVLRLEDRPDPVPLPHEVLIRIEASGVGFVDVMARQGNYIAFPEPGFIPGLEIAGHVVTVGDDVDPAWIGRRVFAMPMQGGGYAELVALPADDRRLTTFTIGEPFMTAVWLSLYAGFLLALPVVIWQAWAFFLPAFEPAHERMLKLLSWSSGT